MDIDCYYNLIKDKYTFAGYSQCWRTIYGAAFNYNTYNGLSCPNIGGCHGHTAKRVSNSTSILADDRHACRPLVWHDTEALSTSDSCSCQTA